MGQRTEVAVVYGLTGDSWTLAVGYVNESGFLMNQYNSTLGEWARSKNLQVRVPVNDPSAPFGGTRYVELLRYKLRRFNTPFNELDTLLWLRNVTKFEPWDRHMLCLCLLGKDTKLNEYEQQFNVGHLALYEGKYDRDVMMDMQLAYYGVTVHTKSGYAKAPRGAIHHSKWRYDMEEPYEV